MKRFFETIQHYLSQTVYNRNALVSVLFLNNESFMIQYLGINPKKTNLFAKLNLELITTGEKYC